MKHFSISLIFSFALSLNSQAQSIIDTVSLGASYANQKWYSLSHGEQGVSPKNNWDLAFDVTGRGTSIHINSVIGSMIWTYPNSNTTGWATTLDTTGIAQWIPAYNSDTSWSIGALDQGSNPNNPYDVGWGVYNPQTHITSGDSLFVLKLGSGQYKKLWIRSVSATDYQFTYANLDGSQEQNVTIEKSHFTNKNFGYYSIQNQTELDREPLSNDWDLIFTQYTSFVPSPYLVTGILSNKNVQVAQVNQVPDAQNYRNYTAHTFNTAINTIGYDWKNFNGTTFVITDSLVYFIKTKNGDVWKLIPTGFTGSSAGSFMFTKEKLSTTARETKLTSAQLFTYPNYIQNNEPLNVVYDLTSPAGQVSVKISDMNGKTVFSKNLSTIVGLHTFPIATDSFSKGIYIIHLEVDGNILSQKIIIQ